MEQQKISWHNGERPNFFPKLEKIKEAIPISITMLHPLYGIKCKPIENASLFLEKNELVDRRLHFYFNENDIDSTLFKELGEIDEKFIYLKKDGNEPKSWHLILHHASIWEIQWYE